MTDKEKLLELTESYLKCLISEVANISVEDNDSSTPFQELGIDSFRVLQIIKKLEEEFGTLPKTLLFENFNISDLSHYFVNKHEQALSKKFAKGKQPAGTPVHSIHMSLKQDEIVSKAVVDQDNKATQKTPILLLEKEAYKHPELSELVKKLFSLYKNEGSASRGTRNIAPNLFIGTEKRGYFNYSRSKNIILVYAYTGPSDYFPVIAEEMHHHCVNNNLEFNFFSADSNVTIGDVSFFTTPFGVLQRILDIQNFTLQGGKMRRLRYQVAKFEDAGKCRTEEYHSGSNKEIDNNIANIIDQWCAPRTMVNPLIHIVKEEILSGNLSPEHRLFLTYLDDVLQNVILISSLSAEENGYLMDLEFYPQNMPLGGLEFAIVKIIEILAAEGCNMLSMGGTYGCKLAPSPNADPEMDKTLDYLREQNIFNDEGNLQFKNKFRTDNSPVFLCRAKGNSNPDNVTDIIMMIADPSKMQTPDEEHHTFSKSHQQVAMQEEKIVRQETHKTFGEINSDQVHQKFEKAEVMIEGVERSILLSDFGYNPLNIPDSQVEFDLKTDSWSQLEMPAIQNQMRYLHGHLQQPLNLDESLRSIFPFSHFALTTSGRTAEHAFCKSWSKKGIVLQNLLFPTTIFHQIDNGFTPQELPISEIFNLDSNELFKGNLDWEALQKQVDQTHEQVAYVCIEVDDNAVGGGFVSMEHIKNVKTLLTKYSIPLVIDGTRIVENARFIIEHEKGFTGKNIWDVVREIFSYADAVVTSLTKDFCVNKGGLIATNDTNLFNKLQNLIQEEGIGLDVIDKKVIALSLQNRKQIESQVLHRMEWIQLIWKALKKHNIPIVQPLGGHCILIDVKQIPEFRQFKHPVASFVAWMFLNTGIRAGAHSVGMQKNTSLNDLVRLAIPIGFKREQIEVLIDRLISLFGRKENIPEILINGNESHGDINSNYILEKYHNVSGRVIPKATISNSSSKNNTSNEKSSISDSISNSKETELNHETRSTKSFHSRDIAIVGMSGRYPKAKNLSELWENLSMGKDCIETIPDVRFKQRLHNQFTEKYRGGFIDGVDKFDSLFFNISPLEAEYLDPQERLFLEVAWEAIEDAGYYPETLAGEDTSRKIGVFVGAVWTLYQMLGVEEKFKGNNLNPSSHLWGIANRVSYAFNLFGPSLSTDTACSSSLTALYLACEAINKGECKSAIVGGVNLDLHQSKIDINNGGGALSKDGVCRTFGKGANGYVAGEGVGALFLKPLDQALMDGDNVYGIIKSIAVNHGGKTSGFLVPSPHSQAKVVGAALENANIDARSIGYIEAHGTGTELGDPIEINGISTAFQKYNVDKQSCSIGSVKTNIGHLEAAAGIVGVHKVLLQMKHRKLVPSLHSAELNPFIDFENSPFYVEQVAEEWKPKIVDGVQYPLRAGISSFGAGGANAHIIIEQYNSLGHQQKIESSRFNDQIFPLSARNEDQLRETAIRLRIFLQKDLACEEPFLQLNANDIAHTLRIGRKSFDHRLAIIAKTKEELVEKLTIYIEHKKDDTILTGQVKNSEGITRLLNRKEKEEFIKLLTNSGDLHKLAQVWIEGLLSDWQGIQVLETGKRVSLPTYPFADKRHWISDTSNVVGLTLQSRIGIHPLIDSNESTFERQIFKKTFHDKEFFIHDHHVSDIPTLPGVAYLDFARKAGELAAGRKVQKIKNILWLSPITVVNSKTTDVFIELKPNGDLVQFEVFSEKENGDKLLHSQGRLSYATRQDIEAEPELIDVKSIQSRCVKVMDGKEAYPHFKSLGLKLGPSFQVLQEVYQNQDEILGVMRIPEVRQGDFQDFLLHPSLIDGTGQTGMAAQLADNKNGGSGEMFVPYSFGEVEILHPLTQKCFAYVKKAKDPNAKVTKTNIFVLDENGKVLVKIKDSVAVPLVSVHEKSDHKVDNDSFSKLYYSPIWEKSPIENEINQQAKFDSILIFDTDEKIFNLYQNRLKGAKEDLHHVILIKPGENFQDFGQQKYTINPRNQNDFMQLFTSLNKTGFEIGKICFAWPFGNNFDKECEYNESILNNSLEKGVYSFLYLCQALAEQKYEKTIQLLYLYLTKNGEPQPHNDAINGFAKTLHIEHSKLLCKVLDIQQEKSDFDKILDTILVEFSLDNPKEMTVRYKEQERYIRKLKEYKFDETADLSSGQRSGLKGKGVYLITGGAGGLGLIFAEYLAKEYKAKLVLTGRSKLTAEGEAKIEALRQLGAEVLYVSANVSKFDDVNNLVKVIKSQFGAINGIIHSAGVLRDSYIKNKTSEDLDAVFAPKLYGTVNLDTVTQNENLDFFVMFSSMAAIGGNMGQCDYSFANSYMDSFATWREYLMTKGKRYGKTLSINWSIWADGGMKLDEQTEIFFKKNLGIKPLSVETGLNAFSKGLNIQESQLAVVEGVKEKIEKAWGLTEESTTAKIPKQIETSISSESGTLTADKDLIILVQNDLSQIIMKLLKVDAEDISLDKILMDLGFDSIGMATFANAVNDKFGLDDITPVLFFEYPSISEIANFLCVEHKNEMLRFHQAPAASKSDSSAPAAVQSVRAESNQEILLQINKGWNPDVLDNVINNQTSGGNFSVKRRFIDMPIAIVGMSGVMPQADDLDEFWEKLKKAENNMVTLIPRDRWMWEDYYGDPLDGGNKTKVKWGGFMKEVDKFDPLFWGISPIEAAAMDPQQRIFLETVWKAIEDSGHKVSELSGTKTGIFVGAATRDYIDLMSQTGAELSGYSGSGTSHAVLANRVSFLLNLHGPSAPLDTACSSSLVALHRAIESIHTGSCEMAIVGGVQVMLTPAAFISFGAAGMLADDGKCKTFDERANGYVRGEGSGAIFIKPLSRAEADGDHIYAIIKSTAENHGGKVTVLTAPNPNAQADLLVEAYEKAEIDPTTVGYIECHGTGTKLGDPIEIQAMKKAFAELYKKHNKAPATKPHIGLTSVKSNIGHLETGAGIAGILKVLLSIQHKQIPALLHFEKLNSFIKIEGTPLYMVDKLKDWEAIRGEDGTVFPRRAGVSSFGFGGANVHVVLEEYIAPQNQSLIRIEGPYIIILSAKNANRLKDYVQIMLNKFEKSEIELVDFAYTLQVGRDAMNERLALVISDAEELRQKLIDFLKNSKNVENLYHNNIQINKGKTQSSVDGDAGETDLQTLIKQKAFNKVAELWVSGVEIDWSLLYKQGVPRRLSLPTYPFAKEHYWFSIPKEKENGQEESGKIEHLHPLVHSNISTFKEQKFASLLTGEEFFLADHMVGTQKILPGVAYMEIARVAGELSGNAKVRFIRDLVWMRPFIVEDQSKQLEISLLPNNRDEIEFSVNTHAKEGNITHCYGKLAYSGTISEPKHLDIARIRSRCTEEVYTKESLYEFLRGTGLNLGEGFQIVQNMYANEHESLAVVKLPEHLRKEANLFWLHPALMDGSIHSGAGLLKKSTTDVPFSLPYSVGEVQIIDTLENLQYGYATWAADNNLDGQSNLKTNFCLLDKNGKVLVRIKDFISKPLYQGATKTISTSESANKAGLHFLLPIWNPLQEEKINKIIVPESTRILLLGGDQAQLNWVKKSFKNADLLQIPLTSDINAIEAALQDCTFDQLLWIAPDVISLAESTQVSSELIISGQEAGVLTVFRIIKALLQLGYTNKSLQWTIITGNTQRVRKDDRIQATHAGVFGLVGSLAKEFPNWNLRLLDVDSLGSVAADKCVSLDWDKHGDGFAYRQGEWFSPGLVRMDDFLPSTPVYKQRGVYVVIGGAGGLGEVWSRFMIENYQAKIVWIGRREPNSGINEKIKLLGQIGDAPLYISADATKLEDLERAYEKIQKTYPTINGVVHSAIVLQDQSLAQMDEPKFRASLSAKVDISVNMDRVFGGKELDLMLFFSSIVSFFKIPGQSNYAAGCSFKDSFALSLEQQNRYSVKIMNWGYWGNVGVVTDEFYKKGMEQMGIGSIEPQEGMLSLQTLVNSNVSQIALMKTLNNQALEAISLPEHAMSYPEAISGVLEQVQKSLTKQDSNKQMAVLNKSLPPDSSMETLLAEILTSSLASLGLFSSGISRIADLKLDKQPASFYERWLSTSVRYLQEQGLINQQLTFERPVRELGELWAEWETKKSVLAINPNLKAGIILAEICLKELPGILSGKIQATDVMFPNSSMHLVEGMYKDNAQADYFNAVLCETLKTYIELRLQTDPSSEIRILEIGAGTGGTTTKLLPLLQEFDGTIVEYCYTDLSKAFLIYAEKHFKTQFPALTTALFDVSKPIASQSISTGKYDLVIAANVLHATPNIRETLRNAKAVLKTGGGLLLNEISSWSFSVHLTFGLLEGWWLYEDMAMRMPGSPGLTSEKWKDILTEEGFENVFFPARNAHGFGQQIVAAESNGLVRQKIVHKLPSKSFPESKQIESKASSPLLVKKNQTTINIQQSFDVTEQMISDFVQQTIAETLADGLKIDAGTIHNDASYADYGVDSIVGVNLIRTINKTLGIELETISLFEHGSVNKLTQFIQSNWSEKIAEQLKQTNSIKNMPNTFESTQPVINYQHSVDFTEQMISDFVQQTISDTLADGLKIDAGAIHNDASYADYGVDSIVGVNLIRTINKTLGIELETISLFENGSVNKLTQFILANWSEKIAEQLKHTNGIINTQNTFESVQPEINYQQSADVTDQMISDFVQQTITETLSDGLKIGAGAIHNDASYADYGVDSIVGVNLIRTINKTLGIELETISLFENGSVNKLTQFILSNWSEKIAEQLKQTNITLQMPNIMYSDNTKNIQVSLNHRFASKQSSLQDRKTGNTPISTSYQHVKNNISFEEGSIALKNNQDPIAIIGMSGRFSESESLEEFWQDLKNGKDLVKEVSRWKPIECVMPGTKDHGYCTRGGFLESADLFDPGFFKISPLEALYMDPQQRLFMEESLKAIEDAGYAGKSIDGKQCGVYVGCGETGYSSLFKDNPPAQAFWGNSASIIPARIAYYLNLQGPAVAIDTACSSSLVAIHMACQSLWSQETEMAVAGGVFMLSTSDFYQASNRAGMLSPEGKCYTFDSRANGFVPGEGVGVVVLKRLQDALKDGDNIHGVIIGSGINQDGSTNGITAPSALSQERLEQSIYDRFNINPETIQLIEAHGTGTPLGDPIEYRALSNSFRKYTNRNQFCAIGSVKTNIGHAATAAGVASVLKLLLSFRNRQIPPSINFKEGNRAIKFESSPFYVSTQLKEWEIENNQKRRAAVSSFGFSGTNSHMIFEEAPSLEQRSIQSPAYLVVLSAQTSKQLKQQVKNLLSFCKTTPEVSMNNLSFTLFVGRMHLRHRLSCVVRSHKELVQFLEKWIDTGMVPQIYTSEINEGKIREQASLKNFANQCIQECRNGTTPVRYLEHLSTIADLFIQGYSLDFQAMFSKDSRRISLPTYPFARERYWIEPISSEQLKSSTTSSTLIHPLLHTNTSNLSQQSYCSLFSGEEFFLSDHQVNRNKVLPGVAYLEMARAAVVDATPGQVEFTSLEMSDIVWIQPITVTQSKEVAIGLFLNDNEQIDFEIYSQGNEQEVIHCQGKATYSNEALPDKIDINQLQALMQDSSVDMDGFYEAFSSMGIDYGPSHQGVKSLYKGDQQVLAQLILPEVVHKTQNDYVLHPSLMDSALQASMGLVADLVQLSNQPILPFALEYIRIISTCIEEMFAWIRYSHGSKPGDIVTKLDIDLCDFQGNICVQMQGFSTRALKINSGSFHQKTGNTSESTNKIGLYSLVPVWNPLYEEKINKIIVPESTRILLLGGDQSQLNWVRKSFKNADLLQIPLTSDINAIEAVLRNHTFDQLFWIAPDVVSPVGSTQVSNDLIIGGQEAGVLTVFRIIKALLQLGYTNKSLQWTIITGNTQRVRKDDRIQATHAGVFGLVGSLAKEFPNWNLRLLDVDSLGSVAADKCASLDWDKKGDGLAYRQGEWFSPGLVRMDDFLPSTPVYKQRGVYVVIGGAGGLGEVWSRFMIENYQAKIVWIGRREPNSGINEKIKLLGQIGDAPLYISADATKLEDLERAYEKIQKTYPTINGVVHSAIVLQDQSLAQMDEPKFRASLSAKVDISVNMDRVFGGKDLDLMLFFSSFISFFKSPGQSNYSAGCTFKDSFALSLEQQNRYLVKIMNWGYWGNVGIVTDEFYKKGMEQMGIGSIEPEEGMLSLQTLVDSNVSQIALMKTLNNQALEAICLPEQVTHYPVIASAVLSQVQKTLAKQDSDKQLKVLDKSLPPDTSMEVLVSEILASSLASLGLFNAGVFRIADLKLDKQPTSFYERWLSTSTNYLLEQGLLNQQLTFERPVRELGELWTQWETNKSGWAINPNIQAWIILTEVCLKALPEILSGTKLATGVMFPNSSMHLVEGIYKDNALADFFNEVLCETLKMYIEQRLKVNPSSEIRILEIGAGTGGTTAKLLPVLKEFGGVITEYCYTDLSKAFLMHAETHFKADFPALTTALFDVSKPLASQPIETGKYDLVIAANVLHATSNIRETLRNAKAVLKTGGGLLLNEVCNWSLSGHLTFGLLEGWWLYEDTAVRTPGTPALAPEKWQDILEEEGFDTVFFPARNAHKFGQQIIAAESNGLVRQRIKIQPYSISENSVPKIEKSAPEKVMKSIVEKPTVSTYSNEGSLRERSISYFQNLLAETLRMKAHQVEPQKPLSEYGLDSILVGQLTDRLRKDFTDISSTLFFEVQNIDGLVDYFMEYKKENLLAITSSLNPNTELSANTVASKTNNKQPYYTMKSKSTVLEKTASIHTNKETVEKKIAGSLNLEGSLHERSITYFQNLIAETLRMNPQQVEPQKPLSEYGLDSILVGQLTDRLRKVFPDISSTLFFEVQNVNGLVEYFLENKKNELEAITASLAKVTTSSQSIVGSELPVDSDIQKEQKPMRDLRLMNRTRRQYSSQSTPVAVAAPSVFDVAIIGLSGRYPQAANLKEFWANLSSGKNCITEIPKDRWNWEDYYDPKRGVHEKMYTKWGGFLKDIDKFDPMFFKIAPREAEEIDPQERLFLESCYHAIEDAGYVPDNLDKTHKVGVFVGVMNSRYSTHPNYFSFANRISYLFNFQGPSMAVDTACSSSLTAIHLALESLYGGFTSCAIAGGVNLIIDPIHYLRLTRMNMLSSGNQCKSFGENADGFIDSEGVGAVVLKPLKQAEEDGDHIYGVIKGSSVNSGGKTNGYTVPNPIAQANLVSLALKRSNLVADHLSYIEAHGTGTALGDPIEIAGLTRAFKESTSEKQFCSIGSVKSNIGHGESAAGMAGLTKVLLQMKYEQLVPSINADIINPEIDFSKTPFTIQRNLEKWQRPIRKINGVTQEIPRIAGISSFGAGGANAHIIVQEYIPSTGDKKRIDLLEKNTKVIIPLSARIADQLQQKVDNLLDFIRSTKLEKQLGEKINLQELAYSLQVGRDAMEHRLGFIVSSVDELAEKLQFYTNGNRDIEDFYQGQVKRNAEMPSIFSSDADFQETFEKCIADNNLSKLLDLWVKGINLDWNKICGETKPQRISLPTYPFARERYWHDRVDSVKVTSKTTSFAQLHPLVHRNTSIIGNQSYSSLFSGEEFFLKDYRVKMEGCTGQMVLPAVACLEMARAAVELSMPISHESSSIELFNTVWTNPIVITETSEVNIALYANDYEHVDYEIYSRNNGQEIVHCQGQAVLISKPKAIDIDIEQLKKQMESGMIDLGKLYSALSKMGIDYGESLKGIKNIYQGNQQQLVHLILPDSLEDSQNDYILHPCLIECTLQAAIGLMIDINQPPSQPLFPFEFEQLRITSMCSKEMYAWVRYTNGSKFGNKKVDLDIDLFNNQGKVCLSIKSLTLSNVEYSLENEVQSIDYLSTNTSEIIEPEDYTSVFEKLLNNIYKEA